MVEPGKTFEEAREDTLDLLDDETGRRYAPPDPDTGLLNYKKLDRQLGITISSLLDEYVKSGGDRFDEEIDTSTDETTGAVDLAAEDILHIQGVLVDPNDDGTLYPVEEGDKRVRGVVDASERILRLIVVRRLVPARNPSKDDLLMGTVAGAARSWGAFDELVCNETADRIGAKDNENRAAIQRTIAKLRGSIFTHKKEPSVLPWGRRRRTVTTLQDSLRWIWLQREQRLQLLYTARSI